MVGFNGAKIFCLNYMTMSQVDVPQVGVCDAACCYPIEAIHNNNIFSVILPV